MLYCSYIYRSNMITLEDGQEYWHWILPIVCVQDTCQSDVVYNSRTLKRVGGLKVLH